MSLSQYSFWLRDLESHILLAKGTGTVHSGLISSHALHPTPAASESWAVYGCMSHRPTYHVTFLLSRIWNEDPGEYFPTLSAKCVTKLFQFTVIPNSSSCNSQHKFCLVKFVDSLGESNFQHFEDLKFEFTFHFTPDDWNEYILQNVRCNMYAWDTGKCTILY
jgi:hypothetical protein